MRTESSFSIKIIHWVLYISLAMATLFLFYFIKEVSTSRPNVNKTNKYSTYHEANLPKPIQ